MLKLDVGDYTAQYTSGELCPIVFERKSLGDLFGTATSGYKRFKDELNRAKASGTKVVLAIEGTVGNVLAGYEHSQFSGVSMLKKLCTMWLRYDLVPLFFDSRLSMAAFIKEFYLSFGRNFMGKKKKGDERCG